MQSWSADIRRGYRALRMHEPLSALRHFERALLGMPTARQRSPGPGESGRCTLARVHYWMGVCFRRAGLRNRAVGSWVESVRLVKHGHARRTILNVTNQYGMARQADADLDDQHAFFGVQFARYIRSKKSHRLGTRAEVDMMVELVDEHWNQISASGVLPRLSAAERMQLFRETVIVFPFLSVPESLNTTDDVAVDFYHGRRLGREDRCVCGSGLPYRMCHGRTPGIDEIVAGKF